MSAPIDLGERVSAFSADLSGPLIACLRLELPPNIALMQMCLAATDAAAIDRIIAAMGEAVTAGDQIAGLTALRQLWRSQPDAFATVKRIAALVDEQTLAAQTSPTTSTEAQLAACAALFDSAAAASADAGVALYALGSADLLRAVTEEVVQRMRGWQLLGREKALLEIGCGHGRFVAALAPEVRHVIGADISAAMIVKAKERCADLANVRLVTSDGRDLAYCEAASIDTLLAADSFPYIVRCGQALVARHFEEAARVLKPDGSLLILNYAYRGDLDQDRRDVRQMAASTGFTVMRETSNDFKLWDAATFLLKREHTHISPSSA